jgi:hypothetical protein
MLSGPLILNHTQDFSCLCGPDGLL